MFLPVIHNSPLTLIRRVRSLERNGRLLVRMGQHVDILDGIAEAIVNPKHTMLDLSQGLGLKPDEVSQYIQCTSGVYVEEGDILAGPVGTAKRVVRAPCSGRIVSVRFGKILLQELSPPLVLKSIYPGTVVELIEERGAVIESCGALIQGVWGNGKNSVGTLKLSNAGTESGQPSSQIDELDMDSILFFDSCSSSDMLQMFRDKQIRGLILGSMAAELIYTAAEFNFPLIVIAGFCENKLHTQAQEILSLHDGKEITINAKPWNNLTGNRPEAFIPLSVEGDISQLPDQVQVSEGLPVKVIGGKDSGKVGTLERIEGLCLLPSGLRVRTARIRLGNGNTLSIPITNLAAVG